MKQAYVLTFPEIKYKPRGPLTEEQIKKNKEYSEINRRRTRDNAAQKIQEEADFKQFAMTRMGHKATDDSFVNTSSKKSSSRIKDIRASLSVYKLRPSYVAKLEKNFIDEHPKYEGCFYKQVPIFMNVNLVPYTKRVQPLIFGFLAGAYYSDKSTGYPIIHIHPVITDETFEWLFDTHKDIKLCVDDDGTFYLDAERRIRMPALPRLTNPLNKRVYSETETIELNTLLLAQKKRSSKVSALRSQISELDRKISVAKHNLNLLPSTSYTITARADEIKEMKQQMNGLQLKKRQHSILLKEITRAIVDFHTNHEHQSSDDGWSIKWYNTEEVKYYMDNNNTGVITEQGDLGLGFNPISEDEKKKLKKSDDDKTENN